MPKRRKDIAKGLAVFLFGQKEKKESASQCNNCQRQIFSIFTPLGEIVIYSVLNFSLPCCANLTQ